jgi:hypothetical protein
MSDNALVNTLCAVCVGVLFAACGDQPTSPAVLPDPQVAAQSALLAVEDELPEPFTARAPLDPYFINQNPDLMLRSSVAADLAIQRLVPAPSVGDWHTHPGPSFAIVEKGRVMITRYSRKGGCTATVYGPNEPAGNTYYEVADEVHRADVLEPDHAVEYKVRFNTPIGAPSFATPADDPGC